MALLTGGLVGIAITEMNLIFKIFLLIFGVYFEILFINNISKMNNRIENNIGVLKDEHK